MAFDRSSMKLFSKTDTHIIGKEQKKIQYTVSPRTVHMVIQKYTALFKSIQNLSQKNRALLRNVTINRSISIFSK